MICTLTLNNITIEARAEDSYVNATQLCKAGKRLFADWYRMSSTEAICKELASDMGIHISQLVDIKKGNSKLYSQGSWIHPDLAIQLAQWISPAFAIQVSRWIRELFMVGSISINSRKTDEELKALEREVSLALEAKQVAELKCIQEREAKEEAERAKQQTEKALQKAQRRELRLQEFIRSTAKLETKEVIYIGTTDAYQRQNRFKVGGVSSEEALVGRFSAYNSGRPTDDRFFCARFWKVHSYTMIEKLIKTFLVNFKDNQSKTGEDYHVHGDSLVEALEFIVKNSNESVEWFNEHFQVFIDQTVDGDPSCFTPIELRKKMCITAGERKVEIADITGWPEEKVQQELEEILQICRARTLDKEFIWWKDVSAIIKERHRKPRLNDWKDWFRVYIPRRSQRLQIKGLKTVV